MKTNNKGIELIKRFEGLRLTAYLCTSGKLTIGYGHTKGVKKGDVITKEQAEALFQTDIEDCEESVTRLVERVLSENQFAALVSFVFNFGETKFRTSTLLKMINIGPKDTAIRAQFLRWIYSDGKKTQGLINRRTAESDLYFTK